VLIREAETLKQSGNKEANRRPKMSTLPFPVTIKEAEERITNCKSELM